ncbi:MAG: hypothetical protein P8Z00_17245 [Anaerolineales bacterium]
MFAQAGTVTKFNLGERELTVNIARPREERNRGGYNNNRYGERRQGGRGGSRR